MCKKTGVGWKRGVLEQRDRLEKGCLKKEGRVKARRGVLQKGSGLEKGFIRKEGCVR